VERLLRLRLKPLLPRLKVLQLPKAPLPRLKALRPKECSLQKRHIKRCSLHERRPEIQTARYAKMSVTRRIII
jgi:hypothetical protein